MVQDTILVYIEVSNSRAALASCAVHIRIECAFGQLLLVYKSHNALKHLHLPPVSVLELGLRRLPDLADRGLMYAVGEYRCSGGAGA